MTIYRERLWPTAWLYISTALVIPASILVFMPINIVVGYITAAVLYGAIVLFLLWTAPTIEVNESELRAGRARLPVSIIGEVSAFNGAEATLERGQRLDARAWLMIRGWVSPVAKLEIVDESDPTPYWLLSSRTPELLAEAIAQSKLRTPSK
ncbi:membrane protein [marine actinobacterium PHSC20C1]|nr:membrane protein [marine actinobacterium PHSC20C1]